MPKYRIPRSKIQRKEIVMPTSRNIIAVLALIVVAGIVYGFLNLRDERTGAERLGDAISAIPDGVDKAAQQLEDRTPAQKAGDALKDAAGR